MRCFHLHMPSPAMVVACVALVVALGGTGYAAITLPRNSVGNKQLKPNAVTGSKVRDGSLETKDFGAPLPRGPRGPEGPRGLPGADGSAAAATTSVGFASRDPAATPAGSTPVAAAATDLIGLDVPTGSAGYVSSSGQLTATSPSRLVASAQLVIVAGAVGTSDVSCRISLVSPTEQRVIGNHVNTLLAQNAYQPISVSAGAEIQPGTYNVRAQCYSAAATVTFHRGNLIVMLAAR